MKDFISTKNIARYFKGDAAGALIIIVLMVLLGAPVQFFGNLTLVTFLLAIISLTILRTFFGKHQKKLLSLARKASLTNFLGILFTIAVSAYSGSMFSSSKLFFILILTFVQSFIWYQLLVNWSIVVENEDVVKIKSYKYPLLLIVLIFVFTLTISG